MGYKKYSDEFKQAVRCDVERLIASNNAFSVGWFNPPYDHDASAAGNKRVEFRYLRHSWKWIVDGGLVLWCVYLHHLTEDAVAFLAKNSMRVDVWALPGKHLGEYEQIIVAAVKGLQPDPEALYEQIMVQKAAPHLLEIQPEPVYKLPAPKPVSRFVFAPDIIDEAQGMKLIDEQGAWKSNGFQALLEIPPPPPQIEPVVALSIHPNSIVERLDRHEDVKQFMLKAARIGADVPKIGLIKRDLTKLGCSWEVAVVWRKEAVALWRHTQPTPDGYEPQQRIVKERVPKCPTCGNTVMQERKGVAVPASESWLKSGKRLCSICQTALWQEARDAGSRPQAGHKYPSKDPRYRLDEYIKRLYPDRVYLLLWDEIHEAAHGDTDAAAYRQAVLIAGKLIAGGLWDGESPICIDDAYATMKKMQHLTDRELSLFSLEDVVQVGAMGS